MDPAKLAKQEERKRRLAEWKAARGAGGAAAPAGAPLSDAPPSGQLTKEQQERKDRLARWKAAKKPPATAAAVMAPSGGDSAGSAATQTAASAPSISAADMEDSLLAALQETQRKQAAAQAAQQQARPSAAQPLPSTAAVAGGSAVGANTPRYCPPSSNPTSALPTVPKEEDEEMDLDALMAKYSAERACHESCPLRRGRWVWGCERVAWEGGRVADTHRW
jgi:hypothetical protein